MPTTELTPLISPSVREAVSTGATIEARITSEYGRTDETFHKWQAVIEDRLVEWGRNPGLFEDADIQPLSKETIHSAIELAKRLTRAGVPAPTRVVPDANAGIVFELQQGSLFESLRLSSDGSVEYCAFENARLVERDVRTPRAA